VCGPSVGFCKSKQDVQTGDLWEKSVLLLGIVLAVVRETDSYEHVSNSVELLNLQT
jgi:hypothetical protein